MKYLNLSIVIPAFNENESLAELHKSITKSLKKRNLKYEIIFVDDGSEDSTWNEIEKILSLDKKTKGVITI